MRKRLCSIFEAVFNIVGLLVEAFILFPILCAFLFLEYLTQHNGSKP